eukprot:1184522-Prorocentrum_minimum.AAC.1
MSSANEKSPIEQNLFRILRRFQLQHKGGKVNCQAEWISLWSGERKKNRVGSTWEPSHPLKGPDECEAQSPVTCLTDGQPGGRTSTSTEREAPSPLNSVNSPRGGMNVPRKS